MSRPMCLYCKKKPARKDDRFCSNRCAYHHALENTMDFQWHNCLNDWADASSSSCEECRALEENKKHKLKDLS